MNHDMVSKTKIHGTNSNETTVCVMSMLGDIRKKNAPLPEATIRAILGEASKNYHLIVFFTLWTLVQPMKKQKESVVIPTRSKIRTQDPNPR